MYRLCNVNYYYIYICIFLLQKIYRLFVTHFWCFSNRGSSRFYWDDVTFRQRCHNMRSIFLTHWRDQVRLFLGVVTPSSSFSLSLILLSNRISITNVLLFFLFHPCRQGNTEIQFSYFKGEIHVQAIPPFGGIISKNRFSSHPYTIIYIYIYTQHPYRLLFF